MPKLCVPHGTWQRIKLFIVKVLLKATTLVKVPGIQEYRIRSIVHDLIFLEVESGHSTETVVLRSAARGVGIDLLKVGVNIVDMNHSQVESINMVFGWEAIDCYAEKPYDRQVLEHVVCTADTTNSDSENYFISSTRRLHYAILKI